MSDTEALLRIVRVEPWMHRGRCRTDDVPTAVFFPERGQDTDLPISICKPCPVRIECLQYALDGQEKFGIWGGVSERGRTRMRREMSANRRGSAA